jgi:hypothetical protein
LRHALDVAGDKPGFPSSLYQKPFENISIISWIVSLFGLPEVSVPGLGGKTLGIDHGRGSFGRTTLADIANLLFPANPPSNP